MSTFYGNKSAVLDNKGRVSIPAQYRKSLPETNGKTIVYVIKDKDEACLALYPEPLWNEMMADLVASFNKPRLLWTAEEKKTVNQFSGSANRIEVDSQGRILLDKTSLLSIGADKDMVFVGAVDYLQLWDKDNYEQYLNS